MKIPPDQQCTKLVKPRGGIISTVRTVDLEFHVETGEINVRILKICTHSRPDVQDNMLLHGYLHPNIPGPDDNFGGPYEGILFLGFQTCQTQVRRAN